jgi:hypothetical protein
MRRTSRRQERDSPNGYDKHVVAGVFPIRRTDAMSRDDVPNVSSITKIESHLIKGGDWHMNCPLQKGLRLAAAVAVSACSLLIAREAVAQ